VGAGLRLPQRVGGRRRSVVVISGHGSYDPRSGTFTVPEGTTIHTYTPHGASITDRLGNAIETGQHQGHIVFTHSYLPGSRIPNYTISAPDDLIIMGNPMTVRADTPLSSLVRPNMGNCHLATCTWQPGHPLADAWIDLLLP
jgi:hypothetical protein